MVGIKFRDTFLQLLVLNYHQFVIVFNSLALTLSLSLVLSLSLSLCLSVSVPLCLSLSL
jgi:hypothetical protein